MITKNRYSINDEYLDKICLSPDFIALYSPEETEQYRNLVRVCHEMVISYLDANPEIAGKWKQDGYRYHDILKMASPEYDKKVLEWSLDYKARKEDYREMTKNWGYVVKARNR